MRIGAWAKSLWSDLSYATTSRKRQLSHDILGGRLREVREGQKVGEANLQIRFFSFVLNVETLTLYCFAKMHVLQ